MHTLSAAHMPRMRTVAFWRSLVAAAAKSGAIAAPLCVSASERICSSDVPSARLADVWRLGLRKCTACAMVTAKLNTGGKHGYDQNRGRYRDLLQRLGGARLPAHRISSRLAAQRRRLG